jgi:ferredoxin--NADP+ reductase
MRAAATVRVKGLTMSPTRASDPGPAMPEVAMHLHKPNEPGKGVLVASAPCTNGRKAAGFVRHIVLDVSNTALAGRFRVGQSFGVIPPGHDERGLPHKVRLYSIACPTSGEDGSGNLLSTTVKRTIDEHWETHRLFLGVASNWLCDLEPGDDVTVTGPNGKRFLLPVRPEEHDYAFFATGTGIAPFRGMVRELLAAGVRSRIVLVMGSPYATDLLYHDELSELAAAHENFTYLTALSRELQPDGGAPMYVQGRLDTHDELFRSILCSDRGLVYACGLAGMELGVIKGLSRTLPPSELARYLTMSPDVAADPTGWTRKLIPREITPSRRMFLEVY